MGSLDGHRMTHHGRAEESIWCWKTLAMGEELQTYCMDFTAKGGTQSCPLEGCPGRPTARTAMRVHFLHRHFLDIMVILEEGNLLHPRCPQCNMMVPWSTLNGRHPATAYCARGAEQKRRRLAEAELRESTDRNFEAFGELL